LIRLFTLCILLLTACAPARATQPPAATNTPRPAAPRPTPADPTRAPNRPPSGDRAEVTYVIDGDTIDVELDGREYRLRYIGVDAPEREEPFYQDAADFNRELVEDQTVILVRDVSETDQYGRLLRYVYLEDGTFVNGEMIANGMARLVTFPPDVAQTDYLRDLQEEAREAEVGMWSRPDLTGPCDCDRNLYDCRDFRTQAEAQTCFDYCQDTTGDDVHNLDGGGDGRVCESLP
jgi:endonuclease YncB( thermonuclease family)